MTIKKIIILIVILLVLGVAFYFVRGKFGQTVILYYYSEKKDTAQDGTVMCSGDSVEPLEKKVTVGNKGVVWSTINLLIKSRATEEEKERGLMGFVTDSYPMKGLELLDAKLDSGVLTLVFSDPNFTTSGGSCRVGILWGEIEHTALQFPDVKEVRFEPEELFQP